MKARFTVSDLIGHGDAITAIIHLSISYSLANSRVELAPSVSLFSSHYATDIAELHKLAHRAQGIIQNLQLQFLAA